MPKPADQQAVPATGRLTALLDSIVPDDGQEMLPLQQIITRIGEQSFAPLILIPALILVSPLSAIPGSPTVGMIVIATVTLQALVGRRHLWLPGFITRRQIAASRLKAGLNWLAGPAAFVDRHSRNRLRLLVQPPLDRLVHVAILCTVLPWPLLEPFPMLTSFGAGAVSLLAIGLVLHDGLYAVMGFCTLAGLTTGAMALWQGFL
ncbi:exopolysaccharide biosynthesis protein [Thalassococcus lentus]|uniref:Exopolysaccharide biosynthesis protein n=1 Tax=Thalassococcus lentus TaxID=1210524 RepID=A0ABT4XXZ4_9RHOB|nr:exopolysaccharide biosynthesis protein [Thalassococcus lentus]MDA7426813.1 exopolysaccharide biosynthesis protein [Thalassococcus lentus]